MKLRVNESTWNSFIDALRMRSDVETAGIILAERLKGGQVLFVRNMIEIPDEGYLIRRGDHIRLDPVTLNRIIRPARDSGLSIITVHTHPGTTRPWFSKADDAGDARLMPSLLNQMTGPHGSMVIAGSTGLPIGRVWSDAGGPSELEVRLVGSMIRTPAPVIREQTDSPCFSRQRLALGKAGQDVLRDLHVVIVGLGGTGSVVFCQLAHLGVRRITVVDGDRVEASNLSRILGATARDIGHTWKVDVAARYAEQLGLGTEVTCIRGHLGKDVLSEDLEGGDMVLSCVDRHLPRALLNRLSYEKCIPLIDMGTAFRVDAEGRITNGVGRVVIVGPTRPCLACWGHIDPNRIRIEALSEHDRAREVADGYIQGAEVPQPSVVAFNTTVAGAAVVELLRLVTGFSGTDDPPMRLSFDFETGTVRRNRLSQGVSCRICLPEAIPQDTLKLDLSDNQRDLGLQADQGIS
ncbi:ThiF family adenylyltransferase [Acidicapsa ligni]|uniref:ThiF family adenylyltransferase n=1 Tax=Acidicapsa ligni TaxID=542300 RepID=UPI0021E0075B|nr:ThiF family adenylyltransferase [Acidicapsa ligni]